MTQVHRQATDARARILGDGGKGFPSLEAMRADAAAQKARCSELLVPGSGVLFVPMGRGLSLDLGGGVGAEAFTPWALRQVGTIAGVPAPLIDRLTPGTAARVLNEAWPRIGDDGKDAPRRFLIEAGTMDEHGASPSTLRAVTSPTYRRVWDADLLGEVSTWLAPNGWEGAYPERNTTEPEATRERALWRSDRDSFAFFMSKRNAADSDDGFGGMRRGLFLGQSEVGARSLTWGTFYFREMCANFLIWDATNAEVRRRRHTAGIVGEVADLRTWIRRASPVMNTADLDAFDRLNRTPFVVETGTATWEERFARQVADAFGVTQTVARSAAALQANDAQARPGSYWAVVNGLTAAARGLTPADRFDVSAAAGRVASAGLALAGR